MATRKLHALIGSSIGKIDKSDALVDQDMLIYNATTTKWETKQLGSSTITFTFVPAAAGGPGAINISSSRPLLTFSETDAAADNKNWGIQTNNEHFQIYAISDDRLSTATFITLERTGIVRDSIDLTATAITVNGLDLASGAATSILGRSANSIGARADIVAGTDDRVLRQTASALNFGQLTAGMFPNTVVPDTALSANVPLLNVNNIFTRSSASNDQTIQTTTLNDARITFIVNSVQRGRFGSPGSANAIVNGDAVGDFSFRAQSGNLNHSCDGGTTNHFQITAAAGIFAMPVGTKGYTVATLPAAGNVGRVAHVTDALAPTFGTAVAGGGAVKMLVFDNGTNWVTV